MRRLLPFALVLAITAAACGESVATDASGPEVFQAVCARCHGADLQGGVGPALGLDAPSIDKPIDYFVLTITRGQGRMPSFSGTLTADQIERVAGYIMEQQGR